jgi:hypothetical protein
MDPIVFGLSVLPLLANQNPSPPPVLLPAEPGGMPRDSRDGQPVLLGSCSRESLLAHREILRVNTERATIPPEWRARWKALDAPCTLVVGFGSWCGDTQRELPDLLALMAEPNPFITVHFIGVWRDKQALAGWWPKGIEPQKIEKVPTLWAFPLQPEGKQPLRGSIVENPPKKGQRMAEAVLELLEACLR